MSQVNLLPPGIRDKARARNQVIAVLLAGAGLAMLLVLWFLATNVQLSSVEAELTSQEATNASLEGQVQDLQPYADLQAQLEASEVLLASATAYEISWAKVLRDTALQIPDQMSLTSLSAKLDASAASPPIPAGAGPPIIGSLDYSGISQGSLRLARWLTKLTEVQGWGNPWMPSASKGEFDRWSFTTSVDLFLPAATQRGLEFGGGAA